MNTSAVRGAVAPLGSQDRLALFAGVCAVTTLMHRLAVPNWVGNIVNPSGWLSFVFAIMLLFRPRSTRIFALYLIADIAEWGRLLPGIPNHLFFEGLLHVTLLLALCRRALLDRGSGVDRTRLWMDLVPVVRVELLLLYAFAVLHKLNFDFLDPDVSCAVTMHREVAEIFPLLPSGSWTEYPIIAITLLFEAGIPLLLAFRRTAHLGVLAGLFFHIMLAIHPMAAVFSFTAMLYAAFLPFLSDEALVELEAYFRRLDAAWRRVLPSISPRLVLVVCVVLALVAMGMFSAARVWFRTIVAEATRIGFWVFFAWVLVLVPGYVIAIVRAGRPAPGPGWLRPIAAPQWVMLAILVFNGFSPYLGLKTLTTFSMFSNLRTESRPNHLFMPQLYLASFQTDNVRILESNFEGTPDECEPLGAGMWCSFRGERVPYFEFRRWTSRRHTFDGDRVRVVFEHNGKRHELSEGNAELAELYEPHPFWLEKLLALRFVQDPDKPMTCQW